MIDSNKMEIAFSAIFLDKLSKEKDTASLPLPFDEHLRHKLLRVRIIVEEAEGRQIRNQAMLQQLKVLRAAMYRGYYVLDTFKNQASSRKEENNGAVSHSFALSKFNPAKRIQLCVRGRSCQGGEKELHQVLQYLQMLIADLSEFVMFLNGCPPLLCRRPYSTYLVMEKCMFSRHVEMEHIINFLMQESCHGTSGNYLDVLPIVGPAKVGKSTLIQHACSDERVRTAFSQILFFTEEDLDETRFASVVRDDGRVLVIVEVNGDIHEDTWSSMCSTFKMRATTGAKIIICGRSNKITRFGTTQALKVEYLTQEAYWYFFKALAFGSADPEEEPRLAPMAMEIAKGLNGSFIAGNIMASMLRDNFSSKFWGMALSCTKEVSQRYNFIFGAHPVSPLQNRKLVQRLDGSNDYCLVFNDYQIVSAHDDEAPMITFQEVLSGSVEPQGKFDVVAWRSPIAPHYNYIFSCEIHKAPVLGFQKKRNLKRHYC
ncbi:hypothetical protein BDA96_08G156700 [Sorghum bicolor]|uniref:NB-ARC domain-containing protein n=1 Tax=Sorghum bicolor TaxID=4558 RepID=A0A921U796_SORBI|nr:hypothetical protein BDA96_08G156700 [Sorghum bicolor]